MEDNQPNKSEAAATRRRRSSILKSQRAPRTPFSELEFNVATPTDVTKSRRVSFSRRTGVAEFITNEATTTWKNFYEEQNKSLESSGNDSGANAARQSVGHIGRRSYFDKQFQEDEAFGVDTLNPRESNLSYNINFAEQIANLECTEGGNSIVAPQAQFNLSSFTETQSKLFEDNFTNPGLGEITDKIDLNFSAVKPISEKDDLEEIQRDILLQQASSNVICHGPIRDRKSISEYIEIDELNMTRAGVNDNHSDMSITDTIRSPEVQNVSKSVSVKNTSVLNSKTSSSTDWVADKENIVINPYVAPRESVNFAVNEESDQVLVFDGKRLTVQSQSEPLLTKKPDKQPEIERVPHRKTIVLNLHDDLPNFVDDLSISRQLANKFDKSDSKNDISNMSVTQALPTNVVVAENRTKRQTLVFDDNNGDISVTQALPSNFMMDDQNKSVKNQNSTVMYEDGAANISMTQVIPNNIVDSNKRKTIIYDLEEGDISLTQVVKGNDILSQSEPLGKDDIYIDQDISMTQAVSNIILTQHSNKRNTIVFDNDSNDISMTQALPSNVLLSTQTSEGLLNEINKNTNYDEKSNTRKTLFFEDNEEGNKISMTQILPSNILAETLKKLNDIEDVADISMTQALTVNILENKDSTKSATLFDDDCMTNISMTEVVPTNIISKENNYEEQQGVDANYEDMTLGDIENNVKRKTVLFDNNDGNISVTQALPTNILHNFKNESMKFEYTESHNYQKAELSKTQDVLDEINSLIDCKTESVTSDNSNKDLKKETSNESVKSSTVADKTVSENILVDKIFDMNEGDKLQNLSNIYDKEVYQASLKTIRKALSMKKKSPVKECIDEVKPIDTTTPDLTKSPNLSMKPSEIASKNVLSELLNMSNASINLNSEKNRSSPKRDISKKSVSYDNDIGVSQYQIDMTLGKNEKPIVIKENDQSEFQMDITLNNDEEKQASEAVVPELEPVNVVLHEKSKTNIEDVNVVEDEEANYSDVEDKLSLDGKSSIIVEDKIESNPQKNVSFDNNIETDQVTAIDDNIIESQSQTTETQPEEDFVTDTESDKNLVDDKRLSFEPVENVLNNRESDQDIDAMVASRRLSKVPSRLSIAPSRDEFLNDITMAQQMLQTTKYEMETTDSIEDATTECDMDDEEIVNESKTDTPVVVKKLHFEDETLSDASSEPNMSALKKVTYAEPTEISENRIKVIPSYLDVTEDIKDLMKDLVKPMPDTLPFEINADVHKIPSTCSMQIQASLITSSQIEIGSNESLVNPQEATSSRQKSVSFANESEHAFYHSPMRDIPSVQLVFDPNNPLNNVFIRPIGPNDVHGYNPIKSNENSTEEIEDSQENETNANEKIVGNLVLIQGSNPLSPNYKVTNTEVNTNITVKEDKELFKIHSSLTVIEDNDENSSGSGTSVKTSSSYATGTESENSLNKGTNKGHKRSYSRAKRDTSSSDIELTPKPSSKIMRGSSSPTLTLVDGSLTSVEFDLEFEDVWATDKEESDRNLKRHSQKTTDNIETTPVPVTKMHKNSSRESKVKFQDVEKKREKRKDKSNKVKVSPVKLGTKLTVQSALVSYDSDNKSKEEETKGTSLENFIKLAQPTIIAKIDKFPFMGREECKWETCTRDCWVFNLLRSRLKLIVKFSPTKYHFVRDESPVESVSVHVAKIDSRNPIVSLCVKFAAETIRNIVGENKYSTAARVPLLLGRCAGVARLATQWGRAMVDARARLGFTLTVDGRLSFTVANIPLRSVWKLSLLIDLVGVDPCSICWPRASDLTVTPVIGSDISDGELRKLLVGVAPGWGHVPVTTWTVFRHLKSKVKDNTLLALV